MLVRGLAVLAVAAFLAVAAPARATPAHPPAPDRVVLAQTSPAATKPDVTGHLPSATWLLVVIAVGLAAYVSYRLGHEREGGPKRREGPISRAMADRRRT